MGNSPKPFAYFSPRLANLLVTVILLRRPFLFSNILPFLTPALNPLGLSFFNLLNCVWLGEKIAEQKCAGRQWQREQEGGDFNFKCKA